MSRVLVHGGAHGAWCWEPLLPHLSGEVLAVDLPGRGRRPANLEEVDSDDWADAVVEDIERAGLQRVALIGHSLAGITLPRVAERIPERIAHIVFVSCCIPAEGSTVMQAMTSEIREIETGGGDPAARLLDPEVARSMFCNDMDEAQARFVLDHLVPEAPRPMHEPVRLAGLEQPIPRTYVKLLRDASLSPDLQDTFIANAGPDCAVRTLDAGHNAMISQPAALGALIEEIAGS